MSYFSYFLKLVVFCLFSIRSTRNFIERHEKLIYLDVDCEESKIKNIQEIASDLSDYLIVEDVSMIFLRR